MKVYTGLTTLGIDLFVPESLLAQAKELWPNEPMEEASSGGGEKKKTNRGPDYRRLVAWVVFLNMGIGLLWAIISAVRNNV